VTARRVELTLPMPLNLANARGHWRVRERQRNDWIARALVMEKGLRGRHKPMRKVRVTAVFYIGGGPFTDPDNITARLKWPLDLLKARGLIEDDNARVLTLAGIPEQRQGKPRRLVLTLEELV